MYRLALICVLCSKESCDGLIYEIPDCGKRICKGTDPDILKSKNEDGEYWIVTGHGTGYFTKLEPVY